MLSVVNRRKKSIVLENHGRQRKKKNKDKKDKMEFRIDTAQ